MNEDDLAPGKPPAAQRLLDPMSIDELKDYIAELEAEIERVRADIKAKETHRQGVESIFKN
jgi:uncharacterized small protein (DUF1192 family)